MVERPADLTQRKKGFYAVTGSISHGGVRGAARSDPSQPGRPRRVASLYYGEHRPSSAPSELRLSSAARGGRNGHNQDKSHGGGPIDAPSAPSARLSDLRAGLKHP